MSRPPGAFDPGDEQDVADRTARAELAVRQRREDLRLILREPHGRRWLWWLLEEAGIYSEAFRPGEADATAYGLGRSGIGRQVLAEILQVDTPAYFDMQRERFEETLSEQRNEDARRQRRHDADDEDL